MSREAKLFISWDEFFLNRGNEMESFHFLTTQNEKMGLYVNLYSPIFMFSDYDPMI